jgi:hypothetical protein
VKKESVCEGVRLLPEFGFGGVEEDVVAGGVWGFS